VTEAPELQIDGPTLLVAADWITRHCVVPDGPHMGAPFVLADWQLDFVAHHYQIHPEATVGQLAPAFVYRRSQIVMPQKAGKGPLTATQTCLEGVGPALFAGWAKGGERYICSDHGCGCGWVYEYAKGEPMGRPWATPLIQITAVSEDQTDNIYDALRPMIQQGPLSDLIPKTGEEFIRLPNYGRIDVVTSNARSRLGQRVTFVPQDETGIWTPANGMVKVAETQRRGLAGMGGRAVETTNAWDPSENSVAQRTAESGAPDIYRLHPLPPANLSYGNKRERSKIHRSVYQGSTWVDLDAIEAEAAELVKVDPAQAERFFGNRPTAGSGTAFDQEAWRQSTDATVVVADKALITIGVAGGRFDEPIAVVATAVESGYQWPLSIIEAPVDAGEDYEHDLETVDGTMQEAFDRFEVWRAYVSPQQIEDLLDRWRGRWGEKRVVPWYINRPKAAAYACRAYVTAANAGDFKHDGDSVLARHIGNATKRRLSVKDEENRPMFVIAQDRPGSTRYIAGAWAAVLSWEARGDAVAAGALAKRKTYQAGGF